MTENQTYNGWKNRGTWLVMLWIGDSQYASENWNEAAIDTVGRCSSLRQATYELSGQLQDEYKDEGAELSPNAGFWNDLISGTLSEIDWYEIASHLIEDCGEEPEEEEEEDE